MSKPILITPETIQSKYVSFPGNSNDNRTQVKHVRPVEPLLMAQVDGQLDSNSKNQPSLIDESPDNDSLTQISEQIIALLKSEQEQSGSLSEAMSNTSSNMKDIGEKSAL